MFDSIGCFSFSEYFTQEFYDLAHKYRSYHRALAHADERFEIQQRHRGGQQHDRAVKDRLGRSERDVGALGDRDAQALAGDYVSCLDFVLEGGAIESDGRGTVFTTSGCLLAPHRNQPLTQQQIEQRLKDYLRATRIIWLDYGSLIGDDTDGHIDTIVRLAPDDTLLFVGCNETEDEQYEDFCALEQQLRSLLTASGKPYRLLSLPMPDAIFDDDGSRLPATYANFLVTNEKVLVPVYGQKVNDEAAISTIASAFPGRKMIAIDSRPIIRQHGSIHCCTMQLPLGAVKD